MAESTPVKINPSIMSEEVDEELASEAGYEAWLAIIRAVSDTSSFVMTYGLRKVLKDKSVRGALKKGIMPYLFAAGFISYAGRAMTKESIAKVTRALGVEPNDEMIDRVLATGLKSHLMYVYAYYFLVAIGREPTEETIGSVVEALGMKPDRAAILETYGFIKAMVSRKVEES